MRVVVIGIGGSGKTTFAGRLAVQLGVPHVELDSLYWLPGWTIRDHEDFREAVEQAAAPEQ